jgi:hypothetical protein
VAEDDAGEEVDRAGSGLGSLGALPEHAGALLPERLVDDGGDRHLHPLALGLELPILAVAEGAGVVGAADGPALGLGIHPPPGFVVLGTLAPGLVFGRDANPEADALSLASTGGGSISVAH